MNYPSIKLSLSAKGVVLYLWWDVEFTKWSLLKAYLKPEHLGCEKTTSKRNVQ